MQQKQVTKSEQQMIEHLADPGQATGIISAIESGKKIVITSNGNSQAEALLTAYLREIGASVIDARSCHIVNFRTSRHGRGGEDWGPPKRVIRADQCPPLNKKVEKK